jgi:IclR family transcriptional regulator, acetate operon repressor
MQFHIMGQESMTSPGAQTVDRAARLLTLVVEADGPITFTELVEETGLARSTTSRLLVALESNHLLERDTEGAYRSGALFAFYAARHDRWSQVARLAQPVLAEVGAETDETVNLAIPRGQAVVLIAQVDSSHMLGVRDWTQVSVPAYCSAPGKVFYAYGAMPMPSGDFERLTKYSLASAAALDRELGTVRRRGYAVAREELEIGLDAVAAPVRRPEGDVVAALTVSGPSTRVGPKLEHIGNRLVHYSGSLSQALAPRAPRASRTIRRGRQ